MNSKLRPIILAGGSGKRLWPLSTEERPKQFIPLFRDLSLFDLSLQRFNKNSLFKKPIIVTSNKYLSFINDSLTRTGIEAETIILEPEARNTLPAITSAVLLSLEKYPSENFFIAPSDHYISTNKKFHEACIKAKDTLKKRGLILLGIKPDRPSSEYGYISIEMTENTVSSVNSFIEKPDIKFSEQLIKKPNIYWNSGMFIFNGKWFIEELQDIDGLMFSSISASLSLGKTKGEIFMPNKSLFKEVRNESFDKGFVEKNNNISMIILDAGWSDLGSWATLSALHKDPDSHMTLYNEDNCARIDTPWGYFETLQETDISKLKLLSVLPNQKISLQKHEHRRETWYIINGKAEVTKGEKKITLQTGDSIIIEQNEVHRLENLGEELLQVIEVQTGSYFGEDDIIRLEDSYGRTDLH